MADIDDESWRMLQKEGFDPRSMTVPKGEMPATAAGIPNLLVRDLPQLAKTNAAGFVLSDPRVNPQLADVVFKSPTADMGTVAHEVEHLMARRQLGSPSRINGKFDELIGDKGMRSKFVSEAIAAAPYLTEKYGLESAYFDPKMAKFQGSLAPNLLYEQLATLSSLEQKHGVDLTKDPVLRKSLFKDPAVRETYNAITGLRQTRLDARDLPTYTRQPEPEAKTGAVDKLKQLMGFANGGAIPNAGNKKLI